MCEFTFLLFFVLFIFVAILGNVSGWFTAGITSRTNVILSRHWSINTFWPFTTIVTASCFLRNRKEKVGKFRFLFSFFVVLFFSSFHLFCIFFQSFELKHNLRLPSSMSKHEYECWFLGYILSIDSFHIDMMLYGSKNNNRRRTRKK